MTNDESDHEHLQLIWDDLVHLAWLAWKER